MAILTISKVTQRRFILGKQGLYPGRRWRGKAGVAAALQAGVVVQVDPLNVSDFEYLWEVYKPQEKRRWGYYTLPILYQDRLVARTDLKLERASSLLVVKGFWLEHHAVIDDQFITALSRAFKRFMRFIDAHELDSRAIGSTGIREGVQKLLETL
jgi:uncharacterized protein YcaQ